MERVELRCNFRRRASRWELLVRLPYLLVYSLLLYLAGFVLIFFVIAQGVSVLLLGRRSRLLFRWYFKFLLLKTRFDAYLNMLTDTRPSVIEVLYE